MIVALARRPGTKKIRGVKDSKQLTSKRRLELFGELQKASIYSIVLATVNDINDQGIYVARNRAIESAGMALLFRLLDMDIDMTKTKIIIDGYFSKGLLKIFECKFGGTHTECLINGDEKVYEISAASIIAKVYMDSLFSGFGSFYPGYRIEKCHGSPDKQMYEMLRLHGPTPYHRTGVYAKGWWEKIMAKESK